MSGLKSIWFQAVSRVSREHSSADLGAVVTSDVTKIRSMDSQRLVSSREELIALRAIQGLQNSSATQMRKYKMNDQGEWI
jgi:hypothetical protein